MIQAEISVSAQVQENAAALNPERIIVPSARENRAVKKRAVK